MIKPILVASSLLFGIGCDESEFGTQNTVKARFWPLLEPCSGLKSSEYYDTSKCFKVFSLGIF
jgi:hypothetical protein